MVVVMLCYARSGGTLLNRCLGSLPNVVIMSEINPLNTVDPDTPNHVKNQAWEWYGIELKSEGLLDNILELEQYCDRTGKTLIIREWSINNFASLKFNDFDPPGRFLMLDLLNGHCQVKPFAFIRNAIDVWISRSMKNVDVFFTEYLCYVKALKKIDVPVFKYEAFCRAPTEMLKQICDFMETRYADVTDSYCGFTNVSGDNIASRGWSQNEIKPLPRKKILAKRKYALSRCEEMREANALMGYEPYSYDGGRIRWCVDSAFSRLHRLKDSLCDV